MAQVQPDQMGVFDVRSRIQEDAKLQLRLMLLSTTVSLLIRTGGGTVRVVKCSFFIGRNSIFSLQQQQLLTLLQQPQQGASNLNDILCRL